MKLRLVVGIAMLLAGCGSDNDGGTGTPCTSPAQCPDGQTCEAMQCVPITTCTGPADCDADEVCSTTGVCIPTGTCVGDPDCAADDFCSSLRTCIPDGTCAGDADCLQGMECDATHTCVPGGGCGATEVTITPVAPNLLIVLDRSCSMRQAVAGVPKWTSAVTAIDQLTTRFTGDIRWGLTMFPDTEGEACGQGSIAVPVAAGTEATIQALLDGSLMTGQPNYPEGPCVTNIDSAMAQATTEPALDDTTRPSFVMLVTDGAQSGCNLDGGDNGTEQILTDLRTMRDVKTFVVGFGGETETGQMNMFADAGGTALATSPRYYQADDAAELEMALGTIADLVIGCDFRIADPPRDLAELYAFFDNTISVPRDASHANGWDYDEATQTLTFYGGFCDQLQAGEVTDVDIVYGCAGPTPD